MKFVLKQYCSWFQQLSSQSFLTRVKGMNPETRGQVLGLPNALLSLHAFQNFQLYLHLNVTANSMKRRYWERASQIISASSKVLALQTDYFSLKDWNYYFLTGKYKSLNKYLQSLNKHLPDTVLATIKQTKMWKIYSPNFLNFKMYFLISTYQCFSWWHPIYIS